MNVKLKFRTLAVLTVLLPLSSFIICVAWSVFFNFKRATATHCRVPNLLPSISAAIGDYYPQRYIWRFAIGLHTLPRIFVALYYYHHLQHILQKRFKNFAVLCCFLNITEIMSLFGLSFISSTDNYEVHKACFATFVITSILYMLVSTAALKRLRLISSSQMEELSIRWKNRLTIATIAATAGACYFFVRHNSYCEPYVYTWFAVCEYIVVLSNMAFHMTAYWDFFDSEIPFNSSYSILPM